jgi:hypothetical protein
MSKFMNLDNEFGFRENDHGGTFQTATIIGGELSAHGIIAANGPTLIA